MKKIIFDCDNTFGVNGCDVDDGLALLYLLGKGNVEICGITSTYGNSDINTVYASTVRMLEEIGKSDIRVFKGCPNEKVVTSEAVGFIVDTVNQDAGNISILATGSLTNLYGAYCLDHTIFKKTARIVLMGGYTEPLIINGKELDELNLSCDPLASKCVLKNGKNVSVITGNNCLDAYFSEKEFNKRLLSSNNPAARYIHAKCRYWFRHMMTLFNIDGFYNWDVVAAAYLAQPDLFKDNLQELKPDFSMLQKGYVTNGNEEGTKSTVNLPVISDWKSFTDDVYQAWLANDMNGTRGTV